MKNYRTAVIALILVGLLSVPDGRRGSPGAGRRLKRSRQGRKSPWN